jgi:outer membrane protein assembly factor BamB
VAQAVVVGQNRFFVSKSHGMGAALYELSPGDAGLFTSREVWKSNRVMRTRFTNAVINGAHIYGLSDGILECVEVDTGERVWKEGRFGHGQLLRVGSLLVIVTEDGEVVQVEASPQTGGAVLGRLQAIEGTTWNSPALSNGILVVRNAREAVAYRLPLATSSGPGQ